MLPIQATAKSTARQSLSCTTWMQRSTRTSGWMGLSMTTSGSALKMWKSMASSSRKESGFGFPRGPLITTPSSSRIRTHSSRSGFWRRTRPRSFPSRLGRSVAATASASASGSRSTRWRFPWPGCCRSSGSNRLRKRNWTSIRAAFSCWTTTLSRLNLYPEMCRKMRFHIFSLKSFYICVQFYSEAWLQFIAFYRLIKLFIFVPNW